MPIKPTVYGADWCHDTQLTLRRLEALAVPHTYINIEDHPKAEEWVKAQNDGKARKPTVKLGRQILAVPSDPELDAALLQRRLVSKTKLAAAAAERADKGLPLVAAR